MIKCESLEMGSSNQEAFMRRIRSALGCEPDAPRRVDALFISELADSAGAILDHVINRPQAERLQLLDKLGEMAVPINLKVVARKDGPAVAAAIADLVREKDPEWGDQKSVVAWRHPLIDRLNLADALADQNVPVFITELNVGDADEAAEKKERARLRKLTVGAYIGVTSADFCMADTATLVLRTRPGQSRAASLVPSIHIAVVTLEQIIADLKELYTLIKWGPEASKEGLTNCMTFISGPSKTADVEATMVHGAHGPREVHIYVITG